MSDYNSSLPVRTENAGDVIAKIADATTPSQQLAIDASGLIGSKLFDGAGTAITSQANGGQQALDVGINVAGVQIDPRSIRALTAADVVTVDQGTSPWVISGTVTANAGTGTFDVNVTNATLAVTQSTSPWITKDQADGPVAPGAVAAFSQLAGGQYNATPPTLADTEQSALQLDANGRLLVDAAISSSDDHNYGTVGANTLRTAAQIGNATGAANFNAGATGAQTLRVEANQGASAIAANGWFVRPTDGTNDQVFTAAGEATVSITQPLPAGTNAIGTVNASNFPTTVDTNYGTVGANTLRSAAQIGNATGAADFNNGATGAQTLRVAANLAVAGANVTSLNPVPVSVVDSTPGTPVNDYKRAIGVAAGATDNHDYTVTGGLTLALNQIESTGSGKAKMEVQVETGVATGVFTTRFVQFNSTATPNMNIHLDNPISVAAGVRVRVIMKNNDLLAQDMYSTISGYEL